MHRITVFSDPHAGDRFRFRAIVSNPLVGCVVVAAATEQEARAKATNEYGLRRIGCQTVGMVVPGEAASAVEGYLCDEGADQHRYLYAWWAQIQDNRSDTLVMFVFDQPSEFSSSPLHGNSLAGRCLELARAWGFGWCTAGHLCPLVGKGRTGLIPEERDTRNRARLKTMLGQADTIVACWAEADFPHSELVSEWRDDGVRFHSLDKAGRTPLSPLSQGATGKLVRLSPRAMAGRVGVRGL